MPNIKFKAKVTPFYNPDGTANSERIKVPAIKPSHCDMRAFRQHARFGPMANSEFFPGIIKKALKSAGINEWLKLTDLPAAVSVDTSGFLARVTITLD